MRGDTGFPRVDAENDFIRARRGQVLSRLAAWLRRGLIGDRTDAEALSLRR